MAILFWLDEAMLGFINYLSWQEILWWQTAFYEDPEDDPPDGGTPINIWPRLFGAVFRKFPIQ